MNVSCPQATGNGCRLVPELDATSRRGGHGEPRMAPAHLVPDVQSEVQRFQWVASPKNPTPPDGVYATLRDLRDPWYLGCESALRGPYKASEAVYFSAAPRTGSRHGPPGPCCRTRTCAPHAQRPVSPGTVFGRIAGFPGLPTQATPLAPCSLMVS